MPEIKHQFTGGKMNKDLDERLVPNGEYRDAMNIQVATSEGSDVGTAQNILGNLGIPSPEISVKNAITGVTSGYTFKLPDNAVCVGAISDEKNDVMYYLVWTLEADYIFEWDGNSATDLVFVFVDKNKSILKFTNDMTITGINIIDGMLFWTDNINEPRKINIQRCIDGTNGNPSVQTKLVNSATGVETNIEEKHITVIKKGPQVAPEIKLHTERELNKTYTAVIKISDSATDLDGSDASFISFGNSDGWNDFSTISAEETSPGADSENKFFVRVYDVLNQLGTETNFGTTNSDAVDALEALTGWYPGVINVVNLKGTKVVLQAYNEDGTPPGLPLTDFVIKGVISTANSSNGGLGITVTTVDGFPPQVLSGETERKYVIDLFDEPEKIFEFKFPRFSYRYKYEDGEYSTFAPFTQVAFAPGAFDYHPRKGYNIGMTNKLKKIDIVNIITQDTPSDVVAIDVLFKDDASPSIYIVDTIRPDDYSPGTTPNLWNRMLESSADPTIAQEVFSIEKEAISSIIPSNQLLRPWDNVPKKALAQDVTGNRLVYANYVQNYDLLSQTGKKYVPNFQVDPISVKNISSSIIASQNALDPTGNTIANTFKSIKSLREYQLGVVFLDEHGRETPVISNASGTTRFDKIDGDKINRLGVQFSSDDYPQSLTHFKFYVKETSSEYYNMAMDRWYSAGDGNIWLAFPSSDRNKIDIDTFLILKKGSDQDTLVTEAARYKVLAIESEAPDFIKTTKRLGFSKNHGSSVNDAIFNAVDIPRQGSTDFKMNYAAFHGTSGQDIADTDEELYIEFAKLGTDEVSSRYKINSVTNSWIDKTESLTVQLLSVELDEPLGADMLFITNDATGVASNLINNGAIVNIYRYKTENLDRFDGRFFVKIYFDEVFRNNIETTTIGGGTRVNSSKKVYSMNQDMVAKHTEDLGRFLTTGYGQKRDDWVTDGTGTGSWFPQYWRTTGPAQTPTESNGQIQYGYYAVDEFSANALYFRRYRQKAYTGYGKDGVVILSIFGGEFSKIDYGVEQEDWGPNDWKKVLGGLDTLNEYGIKALVHLRVGGSSSSKNLDNSGWVGNGGQIAGGYNGVYWKDASGWEKEFGYHQHKRSMTIRARGYINQYTKGVTSMWKHIGDSIKYDYIPQPYVEGAGNEEYFPYSTVEGINPMGRYQEWEEGYDSDKGTARDTEVWFIDKGPISGASSYGDGTLKWTQNEAYSSAQGEGLKGASGAVWSMQLGFGGITTKKIEMLENLNFWNIGNWANSGASTNNPEYTDLEPFVNNLNTGYQLKWKEDPVKNRVYTINGNATSGNILRHSDGPAMPPGFTSANWSAYRDKETGYIYPGTGGNGILDGGGDGAENKELRSMAEGLSFNMTKKWKLPNISPALDWDPTENGIISGGLTMKLTCVDLVGGNTGSTVVGGGSGSCSGLAAQDLKIYVRDITVLATTSTAANGDPIDEFKTLHVGMALTRFENNTPTTGIFEPENYLVIRKIERLFTDTVSECFELTLGGYSVPLVQEDHDDLNGTTGSNNVGGAPNAGGEMTFKQVGMNGYSPNSEFNINTMSRFSKDSINKFGAISAVGYTLEFIEDIQPTEVLSENPAIWETEPKDTTALDIYYEACGAIPTQINDKTIASALPIGTKLLVATSAGASTFTVVGYNGDQATVYGGGTLVASSDVEFFRPDDLVVTTSITGVSAAGSNKYDISLESNLIDNKYVLPWHNCYTFRNGVESNRIRDNFNLPFISNGVKASTTLEQEYKEEHRKYGLIYSGIYNSTSGINNLNQFIAAEKITKDINPIYGSIQKLYSRDSDLVVLCEDKILKITANKDALFNADGNPQLIATDRVLGQTIPFSGEYGISTNPESFASEAYRAYFTDKVRGTVMRLSKDGLTPISDAGMKDWFRDNLKGAQRLLGSYDDRNDEYNIAVNFEDRKTFDGEGYNDRENNKVLTFSEKVGGWVSFKSFTDMQYGISLANDYYTIKNGKLFLHHTNPIRNTFYGVFNPSTLDVVLNDDPGSVKVFNTLNYEGSQARVDKFTSKEIDGTTYNDQEYYNLYEKKGWSVESIITNKEEGKVNEFIEKEGKWFNGINKIVDISAKAETSDFTFQGIGVTSSAAIDDDYVADVLGCTDPKATNYNALATVDDGSCILPDDDDDDRGDDDDRVFGCTNPTANNYDALATDDDGSCTFDIVGCTDPKAVNYNPLATNDDGSCEYVIRGCTNPNADNYNPSANFDDGSCVIKGCTNSNAINYNPLATTDDGSCVFREDGSGDKIYGCTNPLALNYNAQATFDDGSCILPRQTKNKTNQSKSPLGSKSSY